MSHWLGLFFTMSYFSASDQNSLLKMENESVPQWKQQIYLNKLKKKKKNEEMQRKSVP